jgi:hypothetical protein
MNALAFAVMLLSQLASHDAQVVVARPEVSNANVVHVGQTLVIPLYDGQIAPLWHDAEGLRRVGQRRIHKHDLLQDLGKRTAFGGYDASSERSEAFIVERPGAGSINVTLRLPQLKERCVSCRTVHFYFHAQ